MERVEDAIEIAAIVEGEIAFTEFEAHEPDAECSRERNPLQPRLDRASRGFVEPCRLIAHRACSIGRSRP